MSARTWFEFALQQMVAESYLDKRDLFSDGYVSIFRLGNNNPINLQTANPLADNLPGKTRLTDSQITYFNNNFEIIDHRDDDDPRFATRLLGNGSGFSATLTRHRTTGEYTLSFRSLEYADQSRGGDWECDGRSGAAGGIADGDLPSRRLRRLSGH